MKGQIQAIAAGAALALYIAAGATAFAQPTPPRAGPLRGGSMMQAEKTPAEHAARLRDLLQLKPAQEPALQAFVSAMEAARQSMANSMASAMSSPMPQTTPERLDRMQQMMAQHQAAMAAVMDATRRFYAQLDPAQKRAFDAMPVPMMHHGMRMGGMDGRSRMEDMDGRGAMGGPPP